MIQRLMLYLETLHAKLLQVDRGLTGIPRHYEKKVECALRRRINAFTAQCSGFMFSVLSTAQLAILL